jgi:hypothetical protein
MATHTRNLDPKDAHRVRHTRVGIWDIYEDRETDVSRIAWMYAQIVQSVPHILRMLKDILGIRRGWMLLSTLLVIEVLASLTPAVSLWYVMTEPVGKPLAEYLGAGIPVNCSAL